MKTPLTVVMVGLLLVSGSAMANWADQHPRRHQVNMRLERQNTRINNALTNKQMTYQEGSALKRQDRMIRRQERAMASLHNGHITRLEQRELNHQENHVNREIRRQSH